MATYKLIRGSPISPEGSYLTCDICDSSDIIENSEGYVCRTCGIVQEIRKLQYDRPYNDDIIQYAVGLGRTRIGTEHERKFIPHLKQLKRLNRYNLQIEYEQEIFQKARREISRVCANLKLECYNDQREMIFLKFKKVWPELSPGGKYKNVEKLVPIITFFCLKIRNISIRASQVRKNSDITKKEFNNFFQQINRFFPEYKNRNQQAYILQLISEISCKFNLGEVFTPQAKKILYRLWDSIKNTTENIVASLVSSISVFCSTNFMDKVNINAICKHSGISMSTIQRQVKKKIIDKYRVEGFISLVRSAGLIKRILQKLDLVDVPDEETENVQKINLVFGNAREIFNHHDDIDYYLFAVPSKNRSVTIIYIGVHHPLMNFGELTISNKQNNKFLEFEIIKYSNGKGPPPK